MKTTVVFLIAFLGTYGFFGYAVFPQWSKYSRLVHSGVKVQGKVVAKLPENHQSVHYEYLVDSKIYSGIECASFGGLPKFSEIQIGDKILVTCLISEPNISVIGNPAELYYSWSGLLFGFIPLTSIIVAGFAVFRWRKGLSNKSITS